MIGYLPKSLTVGGIDFDIRTDYRDILRILSAFSDPELEDAEKVYVCLFVLFVDFEKMPQMLYEEAFRSALNFIDNGRAEGKDAKSPSVMDWEQDETLLFPAVNKVAGYEVRSVEYLHWWTFLGFYMEISEGLFSQIVNLRLKKAKGKKLEKHEREFWTANKHLCVIKPRLTAEEQAARDRLNAMLD